MIQTPVQKSCRRCGAPLVAGENCTQGRLDHWDYICQSCLRILQRPYEREYRRRKAKPAPPYLLAGTRHGRWLILEDARVNTDRVACRCDCGTERRVTAHTLKTRIRGSNSCGCLRAEVTRERHRRNRESAIHAHMEPHQGAHGPEQHEPEQDHRLAVAHAA